MRFDTYVSTYGECDQFQREEQWLVKSRGYRCLDTLNAIGFPVETSQILILIPVSVTQRLFLLQSDDQPLSQHAMAIIAQRGGPYRHHKLGFR